MEVKTTKSKKTINEQAHVLKNLWEERNERGLLPVLDKMNQLLDEGIISAADFSAVMAGKDVSGGAREQKKSWQKVKEVTRTVRSSSTRSGCSAAELRERLNAPMKSLSFRSCLHETAEEGGDEEKKIDSVGVQEKGGKLIPANQVLPTMSSPPPKEGERTCKSLAKPGIGNSQSLRFQLHNCFFNPINITRLLHTTFSQ